MVLGKSAFPPINDEISLESFPQGFTIILHGAPDVYMTDM
jgi:hypothetical protein